MRNTEIVFATTLVAEECITCGVVFALPHTLQLQLKKSHATFYCPSGHGQVYSGETDAERLTKEIEKYRKLLNDEKRYAAGAISERNAAQRSLIATKGVLTRTKNRIANGVCPCCNRSFMNLSEHMHMEHPEYTKDEASE